MTTVSIPYLHKITKKGRTYYYFRRGARRAPLPPPGTVGFHAAYEAALNAPIPQPRAEAGSFAALAASWYRSHSFRGLAPSSQATYRRLLERFLTDFGSLQFNTVRPKHLNQILERGQATPAQMNALLNVLRKVLKHAVKMEWIEENPASLVERLGYKKQPHPTWSEDHIAAFEAHWQPGTRARLALALLLYTGQRRSDVIRMGPQHIRGGCLHVRQQKTGKELDIPIHPTLAEVLATCPSAHLAFLVTESRRPFASGNAFYNWFVDCARRAGIPAGLSPHGLRKATCCRLAEARCSAHQIASITGLSLKMVEHYTKEVNQKLLAEETVPHLGRPKRDA
jgi:integrase